MEPTRSQAVGISLMVTFLWSSSFVLVKIGLRGMHPLMLVALRYGLASLVLGLLVFVRSRHGTSASLGIPRRGILALGLTGYAVAQGLQVYGLYYLPSVMVSFILNFTPLLVIALGIVFLDERPTRVQGVGFAVTMAGVALYFGHQGLGGNTTGIAITALAGSGWAAYMVLSRAVLTRNRPDLASYTAATMGCGSVAMLILAALSGALSVPSARGVAIILWLGLVNTAAAFVLWNYAVSGLQAYEHSVLQNTMLVQIAVLAWLFLGEQLSVAQYAGIMCVVVGIAVVQLGGTPWFRTFLSRAVSLLERGGHP